MRYRGLQRLAKPLYLGGFLCAGLQAVAPYCAPGGVRRRKSKWSQSVSGWRPIAAHLDSPQGWLTRNFARPSVRRGSVKGRLRLPPVAPIPRCPLSRAAAIWPARDFGSRGLLKPSWGPATSGTRRVSGVRSFIAVIGRAAPRLRRPPARSRNPHFCQELVGALH